MPHKGRMPHGKSGSGDKRRPRLEPDSPDFNLGLVVQAFARSTSATEDREVISYVEGHMRHMRGKHPRLIQTAMAVRDAARLRVGLFSGSMDSKVGERRAIEWLNVHGRVMGEHLVREVTNLLSMARGSPDRSEPEVKSAPEVGRPIPKKKKKLTPDEAYRARVGGLGSVDDATDRRRIVVHEGQGAVGRLDRLVLYSTGFRSCSPVLMFNDSNRLGGLYHFSAGHLEEQASELRAMLRYVQPDEVHIFAGMDEEMGSLMSYGGGSSRDRRVLTDFFEEEASNGTFSGSVSGHKETFSSINLTWGDDHAVWVKKQTASERIDLERFKHSPPVSQEFEAFTSKSVYYGI